MAGTRLAALASCAARPHLAAVLSAAPCAWEPPLGRRVGGKALGIVSISVSVGGTQCRSLTTHTAAAPAAAAAAAVGSRAAAASQGPGADTGADAGTTAARIASELALPCFHAHADQLDLLPSPAAFHEALLALIAGARSRIVLSSLYIGPTESALVHTHLRAALERNPSLRCTILLDALRSTREGLTRPSAASLVAALVRDFPQQVDARLHLTPRARSALMRKLLPKRFGEGLGLQHMKLYLADNSFIISGANLSRDYFTNRQDRYMLIQEHRPLSDYMHDLIVDRFARHAYRLEPDTSSPPSPGMDERNTAYRLSWDGGECSERLWRRQSKQKATPVEYAWGNSLTSDLRDLTSQWNNAPSSRSGDAHRSGNVQIVPLLQLGTVGMTQETDALRLLFSRHLHDLNRPHGKYSIESRTTIDLTTGYFSPSPSLVDLLLRQASSQSQSGPSLLLRLLTAAPRANGFFGSAFPSGLLPAAYVLLERAFAKKAGAVGWSSSSQEKEGGSRRMLETRRWEKDGWTYHAKGIWITPPSSPSPQVTLIGSSNYGRRSSSLDAECTLLISTPASSGFGQKLATERDALLGQARVWEWEAQQRDAGMRRREERELGIELGPVVRVLTWLLKSLL